MIKRSFIALAKPRLNYEILAGKPPEPVKIGLPKKVILFGCGSCNQSDTLLIKPGDEVKTGQKLVLFRDSDDYIISTVTGTVSSISPYTGNFNQKHTAVEIAVASSGKANEQINDQFAKFSKDPDLAGVNNYLACVPGGPALKLLSNPDKPIDTVVICGVDKDLLTTTNQYVLMSNIDEIKNGIKIIKKISGINNIIIIASRQLVQKTTTNGLNVKTVGSEYPAALPHMIVKEVLDRIVPAGKSLEDQGVCFFSAEAIASIGRACKSGRIPVAKILTLVKKDGSKILISARVGTPISEIFKSFEITINNKDGIIVGGPMTGFSVYSDDYPVKPDTDAIIVQDKDMISYVSDYPCVNCGECIRVCPANVPVNELVRLLEAGQYEKAADDYDLNACIECGFCSFVCVSKIPVFQHIKLAKYELDQMKSEQAKATEEANA